jgi:hypothetical protein
VDITTNQNLRSCEKWGGRLVVKVGLWQIVRSGNGWEGFENCLVRRKKIIRRWGRCGEELGGKNQGNMKSGFSRGVGIFLSGLGSKGEEDPRKVGKPI